MKLVELFAGMTVKDIAGALGLTQFGVRGGVKTGQLAEVA